MKSVYFFQLFTRNIYKDIGLILINIFGLSVGIAISILIYLWILYELDFDKFHEDYEKIYRVIRISTEGESLKKNTLVDLPLARALKSNFPQIESATAVSCNNSPKDFLIGEKLMKLKMSYIEESFFKVFSFPIVAKADSLFLPHDHSVVITRNCALKLFGNTDCLGEEITLSFYGKKELKVSAIIDNPENSHLQFEILLPFSSSRVLLSNMNKWNTVRAVCYIKFKEKRAVTKKEFEELRKFLMDKAGQEALLSFQPLEDIHLHTDFPDRFAFENSDIRYVRIFILSVFLLLIISNINFVILSAARSEKRRKEIAVTMLNVILLLCILNFIKTTSWPLILLF